jgi:L-lactate dehydrogenase complex protein LldG
MSARDNILKRIRAAQGKPAAATDGERAAVAAHLGARPLSPRPRVDGDLVACFRERALGLASTIDQIASIDELPRAVASYLAGAGLPAAAVCWPEFAGLAWDTQGVAVEARGARDGDAVGMTGAFCAIAETGTLMLLSGGRTPATVSLLPETHVAVIRTNRIVPTMEDAWTLLRDEHGPPPRAVNFVSGPSRTADIEQTVTLGAHGPYRVHIILIAS